MLQKISSTCCKDRTLLFASLCPEKIIPKALASFVPRLLRYSIVPRHYRIAANTKIEFQIPLTLLVLSETGVLIILDRLHTHSHTKRFRGDTEKGHGTFCGGMLVLCT